MIKILQFILLFSVSILNAQMSDLTKLSSGKLIYFNPIYKKEKIDSTMISVQKIWGYGAVYELEKSDNQINKFEYILLDKNLNKFANGEFNAYKNPVEIEFFWNNMQKLQLVCVPEKTARNPRTFSSEEKGLNYIINPQKNIITGPFQMFSGKLIPHQLNNASDFGDKITNDFKKLKNGIFPTYETVDSLTYIKKNYEYYSLSTIPVLRKLGYYNKKDSTRIFETSLNENISKKNISSGLNLIYFNQDSGFLYFSNGNTRENYLSKVSKKDGNIIYKPDVFSFASGFFNSYSYKYNRIIEGNYLETIKVDFPNSDKIMDTSFTFSKRDLETNIVSKAESFGYRDSITASFLQFKNEKKDKLIDDYELLIKDQSIYNDGSILLICEKFKPEKKASVLGAIPIAGMILAEATKTRAKNSDFVLFLFDKDFKLKKVETISKDLTKGYSSDYLFSNYIDNGEGEVIYYRDEFLNVNTKKKEWKLGIITVNKGEVKREEIPMANSDFEIFPGPAKDGYILIREINTKDKTDQIRLEKLNF